MGWDLLRLVLGLALLLGGGDALVRGAAALARKLGISPAIVGLTVVAFGTSAPELVVCLVSAGSGAPDMAFGNIVGSNIANVGLLLGLTAILRPLVVHSTLVTREIPMMILASLAVTVLFLDHPLQGGREGGLLLGDGLILILLFGVFMYYTAADVLRSREAKDLLVEEAGEHSMADAHPAVPWMVLLILGGAGGLAYGGDLAVGAATSLARALGVGEVVIAATVVAVGTSLPELATSVIAARKGESDLAIGNIVGSNLFNILFVMGTTALLAPIPLPAGGVVDLAIMAGLAVLLLPVALSHGRRVTRLEGVGLVAVYVGFTVWQILRPS